MSYHVEYSNHARKFLRKLAAPQRELILSWIDKNLDGCEDPRVYGGALQGGLRQYWRYRVGDFRLLALIKDSEVIIYLAEIGDRKDIYSR